MGLEELIKDLNSEDEKTRAFAAEDIAYDGYTAGIECLLERLQVEPSRYVREVIINSLQSMQGQELIKQVIPLLYSNDAFIRNGCINILAKQGDDALEELKALCSNPDKDIRKFSLDTLYQIGTERAADLIADYLSDTDINNVITAVEYLGRMEARSHIQFINELFLHTHNTLLRCTCLETMAIIGDEASLAAVNKMYPNYQAISFLEQYSFLKFVATLGTPIHLAPIIALLENNNVVMHKEIINAIEGILRRSRPEKLPDNLLAALEEYLQTSIKDINKYEILILLSGYKNERIGDILISCLNPQNRLLCLGAVEGLGKYGNPEAKPVLVQLKKELNDEEILENIDISLAKLS